MYIYSIPVIAVDVKGYKRLLQRHPNITKVGFYGHTFIHGALRRYSGANTGNNNFYIIHIEHHVVVWLPASRFRINIYRRVHGGRIALNTTPGNPTWIHYYSCDITVSFKYVLKEQGLVSWTIFCSQFKFDGLILRLVCNSIAGHQIATNYCACHGNAAVMSCAKFCSDHFVRIEVKIFHRIWIAIKRSVCEMGPSILLWLISLRPSDAYMPQ